MRQKKLLLLNKMEYKKKIIFFSLLLLAITLSAQSKFSIGGYSIPHIKKDYEKDYSVRFINGINISYFFSEKIAIQSGVLFSQRKRKYQSFCHGPPCCDSVKFNAYFIEFPLLIKFKPFNKKKNKIYYYTLLGISNIFYYRTERTNKINGIEYFDINKKKRLSKIYGNLALGIGYNFTEKLSINIEPTYRLELYYWGNFSHLIGIGIGLNYHFKNK